ncbi:MAG TPA: RNA polymerase sigma factor [Candidatus Dormibacteraeota bacterium]
MDVGSSAARPSFTVVEGDSYADWESVYRDNVLGIYQLVFRQVGNAPDAEDLAAETLIRTLRTLRLPAPVGEVRSYLVKTARTVLADHWRKHYAAAPTLVDTDRVDRESGFEYAPSASSSERALRILELLPDRLRQVLELRFLRGYSVREVAAEMNITAGNAKVLQHRALRRAAEIGQESLR